jgi:predicted DNA-binding transcriptional regulator AlpA
MGRFPNRVQTVISSAKDVKLSQLPVFITVGEFAAMVRLSRRQIDRLRKRRIGNFPTEYELGGEGSKHRRCPRFKLTEVQAWLDSRALW